MMLMGRHVWPRKTQIPTHMPLSTVLSWWLNDDDDDDDDDDDGGDDGSGVVVQSSFDNAS